MADWFQRLFRFVEADGADVRSQLFVDSGRLHCKANGASYAIGDFSTPSLADLRQQGLKELARSGPDAAGLRGAPVVAAAVGDVWKLHEQRENQFATFQVASEFNCLQLANQHARPEDGVTGYVGDQTQGSACAVACGAGTVWRNYFVPVCGEDGTFLQEGQSDYCQIQCLGGVEAVLGNDENCYLRVKAGHALANDDGLMALNDKLKGLSEDDRDCVRGRLRVGWQAEVQVTSRCSGSGRVSVSDPEQLVTQVFCAACSVAHSPNSTDLWEPLARLVLEAAYEAALWVAMLTALRKGCALGSRMVFLTILGAGRGDESSWVADAVQRAVRLVCVSNGVALQIFLLEELTKLYSVENAKRDIRRATSVIRMVQHLLDVIHGGQRTLYGRRVTTVQSFFNAIKWNLSAEADRSGAWSPDSLPASVVDEAFRRLDIPVQDTKAFLAMLDVDGDGRIDIAELARGLEHPEQLRERSRQPAPGSTSPRARKQPKSPQAGHRELSLTSTLKDTALLDGQQEQGNDLVERLRKGASQPGRWSAARAELRTKELGWGGRKALLGVVSNLNEAILSGRRSLFGVRIKDVPSFFEALDLDRSGSLGLDEIELGFQRLDVAVRPEDIRDFLGLLDCDGNGRIQPAELARGLGSAEELLRERPDLCLSPSSSRRRAASGAAPPPLDEVAIGPSPKAQRLAAMEVQRLLRVHSSLREAFLRNAGCEWGALRRRVAWGRSALSAAELKRACREHLQIPEGMVSDPDLLFLHSELDADRCGNVDPARLEDFLVLQGEQALLWLAGAAPDDAVDRARSRLEGPLAQGGRQSSQLGSGLLDMQDRVTQCVMELEEKDRKSDLESVLDGPPHSRAREVPATRARAPAFAGGPPRGRGPAGAAGGAALFAEAAGSPAGGGGLASAGALDMMPELFHGVGGLIEQYRASPSTKLVHDLSEALEIIANSLAKVEQQAYGGADVGLLVLQKQLKQQRESAQHRLIPQQRIAEQLREALSSGRRTLYGRPIRTVREFFEALDRDEQGLDRDRRTLQALDRGEIARGFRRLDVVVSAEDVERLMRDLDVDGNGVVTLDELIHALEIPPEVPPTPAGQRPGSAGSARPTSAGPRPASAGLARPSSAGPARARGSTPSGGRGSTSQRASHAGGAASWAPRGGAPPGQLRRGSSARRTPAAQLQQQARSLHPGGAERPDIDDANAPRVMPRHGQGPAQAQPYALQGAKAALARRPGRQLSQAAEAAEERRRLLLRRRATSGGLHDERDLLELIRRAYPDANPESLLQGAWRSARSSQVGSPARGSPPLSPTR